MKQLLLIILFSTAIFGQSGKSVLTQAQITKIDSMISVGASNYVIDTVALKAIENGFVAQLAAINTTNNTGGGIFVLVDDAYVENSIIAFSSQTTGKQWARLEYLENPRVINFGWTGADHTGATDESAKYRAIEDLGSQTRDEALTVIFPIGIYQLAINSTRDHINLIGTGEQYILVSFDGDEVTGTVLVPPDTASTHIELSGANCNIENLFMISYLNYPVSGIDGQCETAIHLNGAYDSAVKNNVIGYYKGAGLKMTTSFRCQIEHNYVNRCYYGLYTTGNIASSIFINNAFNKSSINSIYMEGTTNVSFYDCDIESGNAALFSDGNYYSGADTLIYIKSCVGVHFFNMYNELPSAEGRKFMYIDANSAENEVTITNTDIAHLGSYYHPDNDIPIVIDGAFPNVLTINGGRINYNAEYPIDYNGVNNSINLINVNLIKYGLGGTKVNTYFNYDKDEFDYRQNNIGKVNYFNSIKFLGDGGFKDGIKTSGIGYNSSYKRKIIDYPFSFSTTSVAATKDTIELYIPFGEKLSDSLSMTVVDGESLIRFGTAGESDTSAQVFKITFNQLYDGATASLYGFNIDTLFNVLPVAKRLDSVRVSDRTDSSMTISFYVPALTSRQYFTGSITGNNIENVAMRRKPIAGNLITDGGFEIFTGTQDNGVSDLWSYWAEYNTSGNGYTDATDTSQSGFGLKIVRTDSLPVSALYLARTIEVNPNTNYRWTFYTRGDGVVDGRYWVYDYTNSSGFTPDFLNTGVTGTSYQQVTYEFTTPINCQQILIYNIASESVGTVFFDTNEFEEIF